MEPAQAVSVGFPPCLENWGVSRACRALGLCSAKGMSLVQPLVTEEVFHLTLSEEGMN